MSEIWRQIILYIIFFCLSVCLDTDNHYNSGRKAHNKMILVTKRLIFIVMKWLKGLLNGNATYICFYKLHLYALLIWHMFDFAKCFVSNRIKHIKINKRRHKLSYIKKMALKIKLILKNLNSRIYHLDIFRLIIFIGFLKALQLQWSFAPFD